MMLIGKDLSYRVPQRFQLSTDAFTGYSDAVDSVFGSEIDYGTIHKNYKADFSMQHRYSPPQVVSVYMAVRSGMPVKKMISTSHVEKPNLTMRMNNETANNIDECFQQEA